MPPFAYSGPCGVGYTGERSNVTLAAGAPERGHLSSELFQSGCPDGGPFECECAAGGGGGALMAGGGGAPSPSSSPPPQIMPERAAGLGGALRADGLRGPLPEPRPGIRTPGDESAPVPVGESGADTAPLPLFLNSAELLRVPGSIALVGRGRPALRVGVEAVVLPGSLSTRAGDLLPLFPGDAERRGEPAVAGGAVGARIMMGGLPGAAEMPATAPRGAWRYLRSM